MGEPDIILTFPAPTPTATPVATPKVVSLPVDNQVGFLENFDALTNSIIRGTFFRFNSAESGLSTVSTGSASSPQSFSGVLGTQKGKTALSFGEAVDNYLKNGGTATTFNDPVMRYNLSSMGKHFKEVDKQSGIYMKDGVFFRKGKLGNEDVLEPLGIKVDQEKIEVFGLSTGALTDEQKKFADRLQKLVAAVKLNGHPDVESAIKELTKKFDEAKSNGGEDLITNLEDEFGEYLASVPEEPPEPAEKAPKGVHSKVK